MFRLIEYLLPGDNLSLSIIRTVRVLRPLRAVHRIPSMRILVMLLIDTLPSLGNLLLLCSFIFSIFGIIGVQLWKGLLRNRCFLELNATMIDRYSGREFVAPLEKHTADTRFVCLGIFLCTRTMCLKMKSHSSALIHLRVA